MDCGADAVKIQPYTADKLTLDSDKEYFRISGGVLWDGKTTHQLYHIAYTPCEWRVAFLAEAKQVVIACFSSPFMRPRWILTSSSILLATRSHLAGWRITRF